MLQKISITQLTHDIYKLRDLYIYYVGQTITLKNPIQINLNPIGNITKFPTTYRKYPKSI